MTTVEGVLMAGVCTGAILYSVRDLMHPDPVEDARFVVVYSAGSFLVVIFGLWMRGVGKREGSQLGRADAGRIPQVTTREPVPVNQAARLIDRCPPQPRRRRGRGLPPASVAAGAPDPVSRHPLSWP